jgi:hypothetical protein
VILANVRKTCYSSWSVHWLCERREALLAETTRAYAPIATFWVLQRVFFSQVLQVHLQDKSTLLKQYISNV